MNKTSKEIKSLKDLIVQRKAFEEFAHSFQISSVDDWYKVKASTIKLKGGSVSSVLNAYYNGSLYGSLCNLFPEYYWKPWKFSQVPDGFWKEWENQRRFLIHLGNELNIKKPEDWYQLSMSNFYFAISYKEGEIKNFGAERLLLQYSYSLSEMFSSVFPEFQFLPWLFNQELPSTFWKDKANQRKIFDVLANQLKISDWKDWKNVKERDINDVHARKIIEHFYSRNLKDALRNIYPEYEWDSTEEQNRQSIQDRMKFHRILMDNIGKKLGIKQMEDWYQIKFQDISKLKEKKSFITSYYSGSVLKALLSLYPEYKWEIWRFSRVPNGFWEDSQNQRAVFDYLYKRLDLKSLKDWQSIKSENIQSIEGKRIIDIYGGSIKAAVTNIYPEEDWEESQFLQQRTGLPSGYWKEIIHQREYFDELGKKLNIKQPNDWYRVRWADLEKHGGIGLLRYYQKEASEDVLIEMLATVYPEHLWIRDQSQPYFKAQSNLHSILTFLFPKEDIHVEFKHPEALHSSGKPIELDLYIPSLGLAFEYQGQQHYQDTVFGDQGVQQIRDTEKREACERFGITLIEIPYWWDGTEDELKKLIKQQTNKINVF